MNRIALFFIAGLMVIVANCQQDPSSIRNFLRVNEQFCTGGQPKVDQLESLKATGVKTIINLRTPEEYNSAEEQAKAKELERKFKKNEFTITDFAEQIKAIRKMGSLGDLMAMIPGLKKVAGAADSEEARAEFRRIQAIIDSMTLQERENHLILNGRRRARIAGGSGTSVQDVNRFLKQFDQTRKVMKKITKMGAGKAMMRGLGLGR